MNTSHPKFKPFLPVKKTNNFFAEPTEKHSVKALFSEIKLAPLTEKSLLRKENFYPLLSLDLTDNNNQLIDLGLYAKPTKELLKAWAVISDSIYKGVELEDEYAPISGFCPYPLADNTWSLLVRPVYIPNIKTLDVCASGFWGEHFSQVILTLISNHPEPIKIKNSQGF